MLYAPLDAPVTPCTHPLSREAVWERKRYLRRLYLHFAGFPVHWQGGDGCCAQWPGLHTPAHPKRRATHSVIPHHFHTFTALSVFVHHCLVMVRCTPSVLPLYTPRAPPLSDRCSLPWPCLFLPFGSWCSPRGLSEYIKLPSPTSLRRPVLPFTIQRLRQVLLQDITTATCAAIRIHHHHRQHLTNTTTLKYSATYTTTTTSEPPNRAVRKQTTTPPHLHINVDLPRAVLQHACSASFSSPAVPWAPSQPPSATSAQVKPVSRRLQTPRYDSATLRILATMGLSPKSS